MPQGTEARQRGTQGKTADGILRDTPAVQVFLYFRAVLGLGQAGRKVTAGQFVDAVQLLFRLGAAHIGRRPVGFRNGDVGPFGQNAQGFGERHILYLFHKGEDVPAGMAAETVEKLLFPVDGKGRCLFPVERTAGPIGTAPFLEGNVAGDDIHNIGAVLHFLFEIFKILIHSSSFVSYTLIILDG